MKQFIDSLNQAHESIKFTAEWSKERVSFLDVQVIKEGNRIITDLFTKPTDTHQLLQYFLSPWSYLEGNSLQPSFENSENVLGGSIF